MNNTKLLKKVLFVLSNDCQFPREYFKKIAKKLRKDRVFSSSRNFLSKYQQGNHGRRSSSHKFNIGKHGRKSKYSRSSSNSESVSSKSSSSSSSSTSSSSEDSDSEGNSTCENLKINLNGESDDAQSEANNRAIEADCIDLTSNNGYKLSNKKSSSQFSDDMKASQNSFQSHMNYLQKSKKSKKEDKKAKGNEYVSQRQKMMLNLYNYKKSGPKFTNDMMSNASSSNSHGSNSNTINNSNESTEIASGEGLKKSKFLNVLNPNKTDNLDNRKSKKLKTNLIDRFNENTEEELNEPKIISNVNNCLNTHQANNYKVKIILFDCNLCLIDRNENFIQLHSILSFIPIYRTKYIRR